MISHQPSLLIQVSHSSTPILSDTNSSNLPYRQINDPAKNADGRPKKNLILCQIPVMPSALNMNDILSQVKRLNKEDQLTLLEKIALLIRKAKGEGEAPKLSSITGIGSSVWSGINIDEYIDGERQW
jgi:hypothetical protein